MSDSIVRLKDIAFAYDPARPVFDRLQFHVDAGERVCVTGANGSGKSTLLRIIMGLERPTRGDVEVLGKIRSSEADFKDLRRNAGYVFQDSDSQLFSPTVFEDVAFGPLNLGQSPDQVNAIVDETLAKLHLSEYHDRITYRLSHGEKRLVALATVLAMKPRLLLLDEPTAGLDEAHEARLTEILLDLPQDMIIISHNPAFMNAIATRSVRLHNGSIQETAGSPT